nr:hypothetical protein [Tanacetum cinerariifolium]
MEQPMSPAPDLEIDDPKMIDKYYESVNVEQEVACLMLSKQATQELFKTIKAFHARKQEDGQLNYNMYSMGKTIAELHVMLKLLEKGIPKKTKTPVVLTIRE